MTHQPTTPAADAVDIQADALDEQDQEETNERDEISLAAASDGSASDDTIQRQEISDSETEGIAEPQVNSVENQEEETDIQAKAEQPARNFLELPINAPGTSLSSLQRQVNFRELGNSIQQQPVETEEKVEPEAEEESLESDETIQRQEIPNAEEDDEISSSESQTVQRQSETPDTPDKETEKSEDYHNLLEIPVNVSGIPSSSIQRQVNLGKFTNSYSQQIQPASHPRLNQLNAFQTGEVIQPQRIQSPVKPVNPILNQRHIQTDAATVQKKGTPQSSDASEAEAAPNLEQEIEQKRGSGQPISNKIRQPMEQAFGADFSQVQVHTDSKSNKLNESIQAKAFTTGTDIFFKQGEYQPDNQPGQELLAHELTHVVQQNGSKVQAKTDSQVATKGNKLQTKERLVSSFPAQLKIQRRENPQEQTVKQNKPQPAQSTPAAAPASGGDMAPATPQGANAGGGTAAAPEMAEAGGNVATTEGDTQQTAAESAASGGASATPGGGGATSPSSPEEDPEFQGVVDKAKGVAEKEKQHDPAEAESKEAQDAAEPPGNEVESKAQDKQVGEMNQQQPGTFNAKAFKAKLMEKIGAIIPDNEEDAKKFKESNQLDAVKQDVSSQVTDEEKKAAGPIEEKTKAAPDTSGVEPKPVTPMQPPEAGAAPTDINAEKAAPKPKPDAEVSAPFEANSQELDDELAKAKVPEETLEKSNEPQFVDALSAKKEAQTHAKEAPQTYSRDEKATINKAEAEAQTTSQTQLQGMHGERSQLLNQVMGAQSETQGKDTQERTKIANEINGFYQDTKKNVEDVLSNIDEEVTKKFDAGAATAKQIFENYVDQKMETWEDERYGEWYDVTGWDERISDSWHGLPPEVNQFFVDGRQKYLDSMDGTLTDIANFVAQKLNEAKQKIAEGKQKIQEHVAGLPENLRKVGQEAAQNIQGKFDQLEESVNNKQDELIDSLAQKYSENLQQLDADIEKRKEANKGLKDKAKDAIVGTVQTIMQLKDMLMGVLAKAAGAVEKIILDPIKFLGNLVSGIKQGFQSFVGNIWEHLKKGLLGWLTGTMAKAGIQMPESFDLKGIFTLVMQVLGLAYDSIKSRTIKALGKNGEKMFNGLEKTFEVFVILKNEGLAGLWQFIQDKIGDLKVMVIDTIQNFVIESVIKQGVLWVISLLNPASAFAKACKMIYDIIMFFIERGSQIVELVNAVMESVTAIANGALGGAAKLIENALSKALPVVISFMASLLGLGGISKKIQEIIQKVKEPIDKAIDWLIAQAVKFAKKLGKKLGFGKGKKGKKDEKAEEGKITPADRKKHAKIVEKISASLNQENSTKKGYKNFEDFYSQKKIESEKLISKYQPELKTGIKLTIDFQSLDKDKKDNDLDVKIRIAPNTTEKVTEVKFLPEDHDDEIGEHITYLVNQENIIVAQKNAENKKYELENSFMPTLRMELETLGEIYPGYSAQMHGKGKEKIIYVYKEDGKRNKEVGKVTVVFDYKHLLKETHQDKVKNPVYQNLTDNKEYVMDQMEQFIPRQGYRFISERQREEYKKGKDLTPSGGAGSGKDELKHAMGQRPTYYQSTTDVGDRHVLAVKENYKSFNDYGRVEMDYAQIERESLKALYTKEGMHKYLVEHLRKDKRITEADELQAFIDVVRTREILVEGNIPNKAIKEYMSQGKFDRDYTERREEKPDLKKQTDAEQQKEPNQRSEWINELNKSGKNSGVDAQEVIDQIHAIWSKN